MSAGYIPNVDEQVWVNVWCNAVGHMSHRVRCRVADINPYSPSHWGHWDATVVPISMPTERCLRELFQEPYLASRLSMRPVDVMTLLGDLA